MGAHIVNGQFQSDKYPTCPPGKVPLSVKDPTAQGLLWEYARRRRVLDAEFADDLERALMDAGFIPAECVFCLRHIEGDPDNHVCVERTSPIREWGVFDTSQSMWWPRSFYTEGEAESHLARCRGPGTQAKVLRRVPSARGKETKT